MGQRLLPPVYIYKHTQFSLLITLFQLMKDQEFELKLLIKQNTEMAIKLQHYRRQNQELAIKNHDLNSWVQNLSQVFASLSAAWKVVTDNEEALYTLMRKKTDANSKLLVGKYINHFKAFDEIINSLGQKITNQGHSDGATLDAKTRVTSFVNNYNLFFMQFVETYFKFNEECITMANEKLKQPNLQAQMRQIATQSVQSRQKIKEFEEYIAKNNQNFKLYEKYNQYKLLDGVINIKNKELQDLKEKTLRQARRLQYMADYNPEDINFILQNEEKFQCYCGGVQMQHFNKFLQEKQKKQTTLERIQSSKMIEQNEEVTKQKSKQYDQLEFQKQILLQRNAQLQAKYQKLKLQNRISDDQVLQSPLYNHLRNQFKDLMDYTNDLMLKINKSYEYLNQVEKLRLDQVDELKRKYEKSSPNHSKIQNSEVKSTFNQNQSFTKFKERVQLLYSQIKSTFSNVSQKIKEKEQTLHQTKESLRFLKKQNEDLNRKVHQYQQRQLKGVQNLEFRHQKFSQLQKSINQIFKNLPQNQQVSKIKKTWDEYVQYVKTRDKKIKAMEQMLKKKDKQIQQKVKVQQVTKSALVQVEDIYAKYKEKLDGFQGFMTKIEKEVMNLSEENYRIKMELQQQKNVLSIRLKNELQVKAKLQEKVRALQRIEEQAKSAKMLESQIQKMFFQFSKNQKQKGNQLKIEVKEKQRELQNLTNLMAEKEKSIEKLFEDKQKKSLQLSKLQQKMNSNSQFEVLRMELDDYKSKIMCQCGADREREVVLKTCPHVFCKKCIDDTTANRNRKCPICGVRFTKADIHQIVWS